MARLATDERLRQRYDELREVGAPVAAVVGGASRPSSARAPARRDASGRAPVRRPPGLFAGGGLAPACGGHCRSGSSRPARPHGLRRALGCFSEQDDWRSAVVEYTDLYTNETFSPLHPDPSLQAIELSALGGQSGRELDARKRRSPGPAIRVAFMLSYEGSPLGVIAYVDAIRGPGPVLHPRQPGGRRPDFARKSAGTSLSLAEWSRGGRGHLVIGRMPRSRSPHGRRRWKSEFEIRRARLATIFDVGERNE